MKVLKIELILTDQRHPDYRTVFPVQGVDQLTQYWRQPRYQLLKRKNRLRTTRDTTSTFQLDRTKDTCLSTNDSILFDTHTLSISHLTVIKGKRISSKKRFLNFIFKYTDVNTIRIQIQSLRCANLSDAHGSVQNAREATCCKDLGVV